MYTRTLKVLTATTAFVAAAAAAQAATQNITANQSTAIYAAGTNDIVNISSGTTTVNVTANAGMIVSSTGSFALTTAANTVLRSNATSSTVGLADGHDVNAGFSITNAGTISNNGSGAAIDLTQTGINGSAVSATIVNTGTITGAINLGNATNSVTVNGGTVTGAITGGTGDDTFTLTNATVTGVINGAGSGDADVLTIGGANTFTTGGAINNIETVNINANTVLNHGLSAVDALTVQAAKTLTVNNSFGLASGGTLTNNGTVSIAAGKTVTADNFTAGAGSTLGVAVSDSTHAGRLVVTTGGVTATSLTVALSSSAGYIASGTTFNVISGTTTSNASLLTSNTGVYRYSLTRTNSNNDVNLVIGRVATADVVQGTNAKSVANALDSIANAGDATLDTLQGNIGSAADATAVNAIVQSLTPSIDGVGAAGLGVAQSTGNQVSNRLASLRREGVAAGDAAARNHMWAQAYGSHAKQDTKDTNPGYSTNSGGMSLGVDTDTVVEGVTTGVAFSYGSGNVKSKAAGNAKTDFDNYAATLYGSQVLDAGVFVNSQLGFGYNKYDMSRDVAGVGQAKGSTHGYQGTAKVEAGKDVKVANFTLTPTAGVQYTHLGVKKYTETGAGGASLIVDPKPIDAVDLSLGGQAAYDYALGDGNTLKPAVRAKYVYHAGDTNLGTSSRFVGGGAAFATSGAKADRSGVDLGAGLTFASAAGVDLSLDYDADIRSNLTAQTGQLKARYAF